MKRILYITNSFDLRANSASVRNNILVKGLHQLNFDLTILTVSWPEFLLSDYFIDQQNKYKIIKSPIKALSLLKATTGLSKSKHSYLRKIKNIIRDLIYFPDICKEWNKVVNPTLYADFDIIISSSDLKSSHYVGRKIKETYPSLYWLQIWGDPWGSDIGISKLTQNRAAKEELKLLKLADSVVYVSNPTLMDMIDKYPTLSDKFHFVPRGFYEPVEQELIDTSIIYITYTGTLSSGRNVSCFLDSIDRYNEENEKPIRVTFYGNYSVNNKEELLKFKCVRVESAKDYKDILQIMSRSNALLFISNSSQSTQIPGKLYDYLGTNVPIICLINNKKDRIYQSINLIEENRCYLLENSSDSISENMDDMVEYINNKKSIIQQFTPINIARQIISIIK